MKVLRLCCILFLSLLFLASCSATPAEFTTISIANRNAETDVYASAEGICVALSTNAPLCGLEFQSKTAGGGAAITIKILKADTDYETTVAAEPLRTETFQAPAEKMLWQFDSLPAGDYFIAFSQSAGVELLKSVTASSDASGKILHYRNGAVVTDGIFALTLLCEKADVAEQPALITFTYPVIVD